jgi:2-desacetyl-2-hydroxyethyl bacteriochlorophyllide A dehydrogenase
VKRRALLFTGPRVVEVVEETVPAPGPGELLVRTRVSAISAGTEGLAYRGELPPDMALDETLPALAAGAFRYPFRYGYAAVGEVVAAGAGRAGVDAGWVGRRVWSFQPHASAFVAGAADCFPIPDGLSWEQAALYASQETAVNLVLDGQPRLGERVAVLGQGVVGLLTTALLARFPLAALVAVDPTAPRAALARRLGATAAAAGEAEARAQLAGGDQLGGDGADLSFELTGNPAALDVAMRLTGREGRVVVGSFYGGKRAPVDLGGHFHRGRLTLVSSQVSHLAPALRGRWDRARRMRAAWAALAAVDGQALISHRFPLSRAADAYRLLDGDPGGTLQVLLLHE